MSVCHDEHQTPRTTDDKLFQTLEAVVVFINCDLEVWKSSVLLSDCLRTEIRAKRDFVLVYRTQWPFQAAIYTNIV